MLYGTAGCSLRLLSGIDCNVGALICVGVVAGIAGATCVDRPC